LKSGFDGCRGAGHHHWRRKGVVGGKGPPWILKCDIFLLNAQQKKFYFSFEWVKLNPTTFGAPGKILLTTSGKIHC